jgi:hypothetical protein
MSALRINARRAGELVLESQTAVSSGCGQVLGVASTQASSQTEGDPFGLGDVAMAEATAHLASAYRALEAASLASPSFSETERFMTVVHSLYTTLLAIDECCAAVWSAPALKAPDAGDFVMSRLEEATREHSISRRESRREYHKRDLARSRRSG